MYLLRFLTVFAVVQLIYAGAGQGIEPNNGKPSSKEVEESVKQEVFLKTANAEPIEIDRVKRFEANDNAPVQSLRRTPELDEVTVSPAPRLGYGTDKNVGIGHGTRTSSGIGSGTVYNGYQPNVGSGIVNSGAPAIGSGTGYGIYQPKQNVGIRGGVVNSGTPGIGSGTGHGSYQPKQNVGIGGGAVSNTPGIGSGTGYGSYNPGIGHGVKVGGKVPAIGSGTADDIEEVGVGYGTFTTRRTPMIGSGVNANDDDDLSIGKGTNAGDSKGDRVHLSGDPDSVNTELGGEVKIGRGANRARRNSQFDRFDTGFAKECNSYYGKLICYRVYTNPSIVTPAEYTCWRISNQRKNCTEVDNIVYLKNQGFEPDEYELPRRGSTNTQQHPRPRSRQEPEEYETSSHNSQQHPRPRRPVEQDGIVIQGQDRPYDPYNPAPRQQTSPGATHRYVTSTLKLGRDNSLELDDNRELYRQKRKRAVKTKKPYYIPPDYEIIDEYEEMRSNLKPKKPQQQQQQQKQQEKPKQ